jgi:hypothetical protein
MSVDYTTRCTNADVTAICIEQEGGKHTYSQRIHTGEAQWTILKRAPQWPCLVASGGNGRGSCCPVAGDGLPRSQACIGLPVYAAACRVRVGPGTLGRALMRAQSSPRRGSSWSAGTSQ